MYNVPPVHFYGMNPYAMTAHPQQMAMYHASMMHVMPAAPLPPPSAPIAQQSPNDPFHNTRSTRLSRWSVDQSMHPPAPTYIPQELLTMLGGKVLRALLLRALSDDMVRLRDSHQIELFFLKRKPRVEPAQFDAHGRRINLTEKNFTEKHRTLGKELLEMSSELNRQSVIRKEITHKLYFTAQQVANRAYGAIIGGRGRTHQEIEKETRCRLILGGKGISNPNSSARSGRCGSESMVDNDDRAHVKIIAPSEAALQKAVEKIEFIMSDSIDAQIFREENRKKLAIMNGTYREDTWVSHAPVRPPKRSAEEEAQENLSKKPLTEEEKKYDSILKDVLNGT